tara:strand:+ start:1716 stop:1994 length:279 start_codon:yes stop_codon:yes gene_type:complete
MSEGCCGPALDQTQAVEKRYGAAALEQETCLCTPVAFDASLLKVIPEEVVQRDYGCGDPTRWVRSVTLCWIWAVAAAKMPSSVPRSWVAMAL